jgi:hypothetical protein
VKKKRVVERAIGAKRYRETGCGRFGGPAGGAAVEAESEGETRERSSSVALYTFRFIV